MSELKQALADRNIDTFELARRIHRSPRMINYYLSGEWPIPPAIAELISMRTGIKLSVVQGDGKGE